MTAQWQARHVPGEWLLMMGQGCLVVTGEGIDDGARERIWQALQGAVGAAGRVRAVVASGLTELDDFALVVHDPASGGAHCLVRGALGVHDLDGGELLAAGAGLFTWREVTIGARRGVRIGTADGPAHLPLVLGAALVGRVEVVLDETLETPAPQQSVATNQGQSAPADDPDAPPLPATEASPMPAEAAAEPVPANPDHDGLTVFQRDIAATHKPGHTAEPVATLVGSHGESVLLAGPVLVGRAPSADGQPLGTRLFTVPSPNQDISRSHLLLAPGDGAICATDLQSTNGTLVRHPGAGITRLAPGHSTEVRVGDVLDLGDGITIAIDDPTL